MLKFIMMVCVLGATVFQNAAEAQRRGEGPTRADRDRAIQQGRYDPPYTPPYVPSYPPVVIIHERPLGSLSLIGEAASGQILGCEVKLHVSGWANQLYVNGVFAGNFQEGRDDLRLADAIDANLYNGQCRRQSPYAQQLMRDPYLIDDFIRGHSRRCQVLPHVSGWANQLYINGQFSGNFQEGSEDMKLRAAIANYIVSGVCDYQ